MKMALSQTELAAFVLGQINGLYPDGRPVTVDRLRKVIPDTLERLNACFEKIESKYYSDNKESQFNHLHSDHYAMFLYLLGNTAFGAHQDENLATKTFLLNKALHGLDAYFTVTLPEVFLFVHPVGTVLGNAKYGNYFAVYQNCAVGTDEDGVYPVLGEGVVMYAKSSILGASKIGNNVVVGANTFVLNSKIGDNSVVVGSYPNLKVTENKISVIKRKFQIRNEN